MVNLGGFYYHFKHDPNGQINNKAYEVLGIAYDSESKDFKNETLVVYRALYKSSITYRDGVGFWVRPLKIFNEFVERDKKTFKRFTKITNQDTIKKLEKISKDL